jgi:pimeloyl-ACP methyl ester carboxylesterase
MWQTLAFNDGDKIIHKLQQYNLDRYSNGEKYTNTLINTNIPLAYISGFDDIISGEHVGIEFNRIIKNSSVVLLKNVGHWPHLENPSLYLIEIHKFFNISIDISKSLK